MPKRLIVLCDGTGQSAARGASALPTNVKRFGDMLQPTYPCDDACRQHHKSTDKNEQHPQIVFYQSGVGTAEQSRVSQMMSAGSGLGIDDHILDAYTFLANNYLPGDEIFIFGFSRGAFTARVVANLVVRLGLLQKHLLWILRRAWVQYKVNDDHQSFDFFLHNLFEKTGYYSQKATVKVLGVWDTVAAVGLPDYDVVEKTGLNKSHEFYDLRLNWGVEHAFHALALDECRLTFGPTLMYLPDEKNRPILHKRDEDLKPDETNPQPNPDYPVPELVQTWFSGAHTDVGGGYASEHISNITLAWMVDHCSSRNLLRFHNPNHVSIYTAKDGTRTVRENKNSAIKIIRNHHHPGSLQDGLRKVNQTWLPDKWATPKRMCEDTYPGWGCGWVRDSYKEMGLAINWQYRTPGNYAKMGEHRGFAGPILKVESVTYGLSYLWLPSYNVWPFKKPDLEKPKRELKQLYEKNADADLEALIRKLPLCKNPACVHPKPEGDGQIKQGSTREAIHESVFARWQAQKNGAKLNNGVWCPESLSAFTVVPLPSTNIGAHSLKTAQKPYRRIKVDNNEDAEAIKRGCNYKWRGECVNSPGFFFDLYEEPNCLPPTIKKVTIDGADTENVTWTSGMMSQLLDHDNLSRCPIILKRLPKNDNDPEFRWLEEGFIFKDYRKDNGNLKKLKDWEEFWNNRNTRPAVVPHKHRQAEEKQVMWDCYCHGPEPVKVPVMVPKAEGELTANDVATLGHCPADGCFGRFCKANAKRKANGVASS